MNLILGQRVFDVCEKELFNVSILLRCLMHTRLLLNNSTDLCRADSSISGWEKLLPLASPAINLLDTYQLNLEQCKT